MKVDQFQFCFVVNRALLSKRRVVALGTVPCRSIRTYRLLGLHMGMPVTSFHAFPLQGCEKAFGHCSVSTIPRTAHPVCAIVFGQQGLLRARSVVHATTSVMEPSHGRILPRQRHAYGSTCQTGVQAVLQCSTTSDVTPHHGRGQETATLGALVRTCSHGPKRGPQPHSAGERNAAALHVEQADSSGVRLSCFCSDGLAWLGVLPRAVRIQPTYDGNEYLVPSVLHLSAGCQSVVCWRARWSGFLRARVGPWRLAYGLLACERRSSQRVTPQEADTSLQWGTLCDAFGCRRTSRQRLCAGRRCFLYERVLLLSLLQRTAQTYTSSAHACVCHCRGKQWVPLVRRDVLRAVSTFEACLGVCPTPARPATPAYHHQSLIAQLRA